jgi:hypothetical protein
MLIHVQSRPQNEMSDSELEAYDVLAEMTEERLDREVKANRLARQINYQLFYELGREEIRFELLDIRELDRPPKKRFYEFGVSLPGDTPMDSVSEYLRFFFRRFRIVQFKRHTVCDA